MKRQFDLLTHPAKATEKIETVTSIPWKNPRDYNLQTPDEITELFDDIELSFNGTKLVVTAIRNDTSPELEARFAAVVTCETDESKAQDPPDFGWPELVTKIPPPPEPLANVVVDELADPALS